MAGFERGRNLDKLGLHAQDTAELFFTDVSVPVEQPARRGGAGFHPAGGQSAPGAAVDRRRGHRGGSGRPGLTLDYVKERRAFGEPIGSFQNSRFVLAELATEIELAETFIDRCVLALNEGAALPWRRRLWPSGGAPSSSSGSSTAACSSTGATAT